MIFDIFEQKKPSFEISDRHFLAIAVRFWMVCQGFDSNRSKSKSIDPGIVSSLLTEKTSAEKSIAAENKKVSILMAQNQGNEHKIGQIS